jgi:hypothetical protein
MLPTLWLPILLSGIALFFASFVSWMLSGLHKRDWIKMSSEEEFLKTARAIGLAPGNYMFPAAETPEEMKSAAHQEKWKQGPRGILTVFGEVNMGANLALTIAYFLVTSFLIAYLATIVLKPGADALTVFRFFSTAGLLTYLSAIVQHAIWFRCRIVGHVIESIAYAAILGGIFAALWPK